MTALSQEDRIKVEAHPLIPVGVFSKPGRDMRAWIISNAFVSVYRRGEGGGHAKAQLYRRNV